MSLLLATNRSTEKPQNLFISLEEFPDAFRASLSVVCTAIHWIKLLIKQRRTKCKRGMTLSNTDADGDGDLSCRPIWAILLLCSVHILHDIRINERTHKLVVGVIRRRLYRSSLGLPAAIIRD